jgi:hypothetical protein
MRSWWLHQGTVDPKLLLLSVCSAVVMFILGLIYFKSKEREFADII